MKIDGDTARRLVSLSNVNLSEADLKNLRGDLDKITECISELDSLDTSGIEPTFEVTGLVNILREDVIEDQISREELLKLAPLATNDAVKVPKVL